MHEIDSYILCSSFYYSMLSYYHILKVIVTNGLKSWFGYWNFFQRDTKLICFFFQCHFNIFSKWVSFIKSNFIANILLNSQTMKNYGKKAFFFYLVLLFTKSAIKTRRSQNQQKCVYFTKKGVKTTMIHIKYEVWASFNIKII